MGEYWFHSWCEQADGPHAPESLRARLSGESAFRRAPTCVRVEPRGAEAFFAWRIDPSLLDADDFQAVFETLDQMRPEKGLGFRLV